MRLLSKLSGHTDSVLCCEFSPSTTLLATGSEDGTCGIFDMRIANQVLKKDLNPNPHSVDAGGSRGKQDVSAVLFLPHDDHTLLAASGSAIFTLDLRQFSEPVREYSFNSDEITSMSVNGKGSFLAAADDSGEVKICSCVQFPPTKPWEVITGGLDAKVIKWDFSRGRPRHVWEIGIQLPSLGEGRALSRLCNPPLVHALAVLPHDIDTQSGQNVFAAARGDCVVSIHDVDAHKKEGGSGRGRGRGRGRGKGRGRGRSFGGRGDGEESDREQRMEGHKASVSHLTFSKFSASPQFLVSGGNDRQIAIWEWGKEESSSETGETESKDDDVEIDKNSESSKSGRNAEISEHGNDGEDVTNGEECQGSGFDPSREKAIDRIEGGDEVDGTKGASMRNTCVLVTNHRKKVNWLATRASDQGNLCVADTSKRISVYHVA